MQARSASTYNLVLQTARKMVTLMGISVSLEGLRFRRVENRVRHHEDLLTVDEVRAVIREARTTAAASAIAVCWDGALRVGELLSFEMRDIRQDEYGYVIIVRGKTGERPVRLVRSCGHLSAWLRHRGEEPGRVFPFTADWLRGHLRRAARRAGIRKRVYPHLLRHSRLTELAKSLPRQALVAFAGWNAETDMDSVYVHLSQQDVDSAVLRAAGVPVGSSESSVQRCPRCHLLTDGGDFCSNCGAVLQVTADDLQRLTLEQMMFRALQMPEVQRAMIDAFKRIIDEQKE